MTLPYLHQASVHDYKRYVGPLSKILNVTTGKNTTTHVASIAFSDDIDVRPERAVVKAFEYSSHAWANEAVAWMLASLLQVAVPTKAAILIIEPKDVTPEHGEELNSFVKTVSGPFVLWCTTVVAPSDDILMVVGKNWESKILEKVEGRQLGAFDAFIGNVDRHNKNVIYWLTGGGIPVAIDNERMAYMQDWKVYPIFHLDVTDNCQTHCFETIISGRNSADSKRKRRFRGIANEMKGISAAHAPAVASLRNTISTILDENFGGDASSNLLCYLDERALQTTIDTRYGPLI